MGLGQYNSLGEYCSPHTDAKVFLFFTTQLYRYFSVVFLFALFSDEPGVFLPKYSQTAIQYAAHFRRVVNMRLCFGMLLLYCILLNKKYQLTLVTTRMYNIDRGDTSCKFRVTLQLNRKNTH